MSARKHARVASVITLLAAVSCGSEPRENGIRGGEARGPAAARADAPEIVTLRTREGFIEIRSAPDGRRFTLLTLDGRVLAPNLTEENLRADFPGHWQAMERALANPDASLHASGEELFDASGAR